MFICKTRNNGFIRLFLLLGLMVVIGCHLPPAEKPGQPLGPKQEIKDIKAEVYPVPPAVVAGLPGLLNDNIYIYREISASVNLVAYDPDYSLSKAIGEISQAFVALLDTPKLAEGIDFWIIQVQPRKGPEVIVWGVRPEEARRFQQSRDLTSFFRDSEYVLIDDKIIPKGDQRAAFLNPGAGPSPGTPEPQKGSTHE